MTKWIIYWHFEFDEKIYNKIQNSKIYRIEDIRNLRDMDFNYFGVRGKDRFTKMVNLYNKYAFENRIEQIVNIKFLKENLRKQKELLNNNIKLINKDSHSIEKTKQIINKLENCLKEENNNIFLMKYFEIELNEIK